MRYMKRRTVPKEWPIARKGSTFVTESRSKKGIPVLIVLRDLLKFAKTKKEIKKEINKKSILLNGKPIKDARLGMALFDILFITSSNKYYILDISEKRKFYVREIDEKNAERKIAKIIGKRMLKGKKIQLNLSDGINLFYEKECKTGDSVLVNFKDKKVEKYLPLEKGRKVIVFAGKHSGEKGKIVEINPEKKMAIIDNGIEQTNILTKQIMVVE